MGERALSEKLLEILACPACESRPRVELIEGGLHCRQCGRIYPIENGVPIMLVDKATESGKVEEG
ncbi:MAG: Trm112 family protein [Armatimonadota bacterium]|jgi:uncharacterized protein YbaR (Trm112 family)